jgi:hypothetical protein
VLTRSYFAENVAYLEGEETLLGIGGGVLVPKQEPGGEVPEHADELLHGRDPPGRYMYVGVVTYHELV